MSNSTTGKIWALDSVGIVSNTPVWIRKLVLYPNAAADAAVLNYFNIEATVATGTGTIVGTATTGTITGTNTMTFSGGTYLPAAIADGYVFELKSGNGDAANLNVKTLVATAGNNTVVVVQGAPWANESGKVYSYATYTSYLFAKLLCPATEKMAYQVDFAKPFRVPNLILETISTSAVVHVYLD